jgi:hypothetical protein
MSDAETHPISHADPHCHQAHHCHDHAPPPDRGCGCRELVDRSKWLLFVAASLISASAFVGGLVAGFCYH